MTLFRQSSLRLATTPPPLILRPTRKHTQQPKARQAMHSHQRTNSWHSAVVAFSRGPGGVEANEHNRDEVIAHTRQLFEALRTDSSVSAEVSVRMYHRLKGNTARGREAFYQMLRTLLARDHWLEATRALVSSSSSLPSPRSFDDIACFAGLARLCLRRCSDRKVRHALLQYILQHPNVCNRSWSRALTLMSVRPVSGKANECLVNLQYSSAPLVMLMNTLHQQTDMSVRPNMWVHATRALLAHGSGGPWSTGVVKTYLRLFEHDPILHIAGFHLLRRVSDVLRRELTAVSGVAELLVGGNPQWQDALVAAAEVCSGNPARPDPRHFPRAVTPQLEVIRGALEQCERHGLWRLAIDILERVEGLKFDDQLQARREAFVRAMELCCVTGHRSAASSLWLSKVWNQQHGDVTALSKRAFLQMLALTDSATRARYAPRMLDSLMLGVGDDKAATTRCDVSTVDGIMSFCLREGGGGVPTVRSFDRASALVKSAFLVHWKTLGCSMPELLRDVLVVRHLAADDSILAACEEADVMRVVHTAVPTHSHLAVRTVNKVLSATSRSKKSLSENLSFVAQFVSKCQGHFVCDDTNTAGADGDLVICVPAAPGQFQNRDAVLLDDVTNLTFRRELSRHNTLTLDSSGTFWEIDLAPFLNAMRPSVLRSQYDINQNEAGLRILYEDADILVIWKPCGPTMASIKGNGGNFVLDVLHAYPALAHLPSCGVVHRIDADTSGPVVFAKTHAALVFVQNQFANQIVKVREYVVAMHRCDDGFDALHGVSSGVLRKRAPASMSMYFDVMSRSSRYMVARVRLHTGKRHQIRSMFGETGWSVLGDVLYGPTAGTASPIATRLMLHSTRIGVETPSGATVEVECTLPADFDRVTKMIETERHREESYQ
eukprot:PhM_4_TR4894/c0_g1_i1/m.81381